VLLARCARFLTETYRHFEAVLEDLRQISRQPDMKRSQLTNLITISVNGTEKDAMGSTPYYKALAPIIKSISSICAKTPEAQFVVAAYDFIGNGKYETASWPIPQEICDICQLPIELASQHSAACTGGHIYG
jgi:hypothetical protein